MTCAGPGNIVCVLLTSHLSSFQICFLPACHKVMVPSWAATISRLASLLRVSKITRLCQLRGTCSCEFDFCGSRTRERCPLYPCILTVQYSAFPARLGLTTVHTETRKVRLQCSVKGLHYKSPAVTRPHDSIIQWDDTRRPASATTVL